MARIDVTQTFVGLDGDVLTDQDKKELTLRSICENVLLGTNPKEQIDGEEKVKRYALAMKIHEHDATDMTAEEITLVKKVIGEAYGPMVVGRAWEMLDPKTEEVPKEEA